MIAAPASSLVDNVSSRGESAEARKKTEEENVVWHQAITTDMLA
jgi:hypothetical protein